MDDIKGCFIELIITIIILAVAFGIAYLIGTSDLPDWVKFWLLK